MTFADQIRAHQSRCQPQLLRLRILARSDPADALPQRAAAEIREATSTVIAEAEAAGRAALAAAGALGDEPGTFLLVRLTRLTEAAHEAIAAALGGNAAMLRRHLRRFDTLASAIWAVQDSVYGKVPLPRTPALADGPRLQGGARIRSEKSLLMIRNGPVLRHASARPTCQ